MIYLITFSLSSALFLFVVGPIEIINLILEIIIPTYWSIILLVNQYAKPSPKWFLVLSIWVTIGMINLIQRICPPIMLFPGYTFIKMLILILLYIPMGPYNLGFEMLFDKLWEPIILNVHDLCIVWYEDMKENLSDELKQIYYFNKLVEYLNNANNENNKSESSESDSYWIALKNQLFNYITFVPRIHSLINYSLNMED